MIQLKKIRDPIKKNKVQELHSNLNMPQQIRNSHNNKILLHAKSAYVREHYKLCFNWLKIEQGEQVEVSKLVKSYIAEIR